MKTHITFQDAIVDALANQYGAEKIIMFGSHARGTTQKDSDLDLIVIKKTRVPFLKRMREVGKLLAQSGGGQAVDVLVYTPEEFEKLSKRWNPFFHRILKEGKTVYGE